MRIPLFARVAAVGLLLLGVFAVLWIAPTDTYIFLPNKAHPVEPLVKVAGGRAPTDGGGIYYVDVLVRKATFLEKQFPGVFHDGASLIPESQLLQQGQTDRERRSEELREMRRSQRRAAAVALRELGYDVVVRRIGARIESVDPDAPAADALEPGDVIVAVDGLRVRAPTDLRRLVTRRRPGEVVRLRIVRDERPRDLSVRTVPARDGGPPRAVIGVFVEQADAIHLPLKVEIDSGNVGGPSAGLAFALDVMEELGRDVDHGYRVAATGSITTDGTVGRVGGLRQKTIGVRRSGLDIFLVPAGDNTSEARRYAGSLRVIPVKTFRQALRALATLPRKRQE